MRAVTGAGPTSGSAELPSALELVSRLRAPGAPPPFLFLDYDGTLTPIVAEPRLAVLRTEVRDAVRRASERWPVAIVSGRDLLDVRDRVGIPGLVYVGNHGLEIEGPGDRREERGTEASEALDLAEGAVREATRSIPGVVIERKRMGIAVHHRLVDAARVPRPREGG